MDQIGLNERFLFATVLVFCLSSTKADGSYDIDEYPIFWLIGGFAVGFFVCCWCMCGQCDNEDDGSGEGEEEGNNSDAASPNHQTEDRVDTGARTQPPPSSSGSRPTATTTTNGHMTTSSSGGRRPGAPSSNQTHGILAAGGAAATPPPSAPGESIPMQPLLARHYYDSQDPPSYYSLFPENR